MDQNNKPPKTTLIVTANLASILVVRPQLVAPFNSLQEFMAQGRTALAPEVVVDQMALLHPSLHIVNHVSAKVEMTYQGLKESEYEGIIVPHARWMKMKVEGNACGLYLVGKSISSFHGGFVCSRQSPCVLSAISYAIHKMILTGKIAELAKKWFVPVQCAAEVTTQRAGLEQTLDIPDMAGLFMLTWFAIVVAFLMKLIIWASSEQPAEDKGMSGGKENMPIQKPKPNRRFAHGRWFTKASVQPPRHQSIARLRANASSRHDIGIERGLGGLLPQDLAPQHAERLTQRSAGIGATVDDLLEEEEMRSLQAELRGVAWV